MTRSIFDTNGIVLRQVCHDFFFPLGPTLMLSRDENEADELPAPPEDLLTDGADVSPVSNLLI